MTSLIDVIEISNYRIEEAPGRLGVQAVVNAANPTLMGNRSGVPPTVDYAIHRAVDRQNRCNGYLDERIKETFDGAGPYENEKIRCERGQVVSTPGYGFCDTILYTVGPKSDDRVCKPNVCSSSLIYNLEMCYKNIVEEAVKNRSITKIAVPLIGAGNYEIDYELAVKTAITTLYNTLLQMKHQDSEFFEYVKLEKIFLLVIDWSKFQRAKNILETYKKVFDKEHRVVSRSSTESMRALHKEIKLNDEKRGYFSVAKCFRICLLWIREYIFGFSTGVKGVIGGIDWVRRRKVVEIFTASKIIIPIIGYIVMKFCVCQPLHILVICISVYSLLDTVTYLLALIIFADIQRPSANTIRSMLMLAINYIEVSVNIALLYAVFSGMQVGFWEASIYGLTGNYSIEPHSVIVLVNSAAKFFFVTMVFGYFVNHLRQRKFRDMMGKEVE